MENKPIDRRVRRTRDQIQKAFMDLMLEKGYSSVTVQDIIDRANVGRSTFYAHFTDKEELLGIQLEDFRGYLRQNRCYSHVQPGEPQLPILGFSLAILRHAEGHFEHHLRLLVKSDAAGIIHRRILKILKDCAQEELEAISREYSSSVPLDALAQYIINAFLGLMTWWLENKLPYPAEQMNQLCYSLIVSGTHTVLAPRK